MILSQRFWSRLSIVLNYNLCERNSSLSDYHTVTSIRFFKLNSIILSCILANASLNCFVLIQCQSLSTPGLSSPVFYRKNDSKRVRYGFKLIQRLYHLIRRNEQLKRLVLPWVNSLNSTHPFSLSLNTVMHHKIHFDKGLLCHRSCRILLYGGW